VQVLYRLDGGKQSSTSFEDMASATKFKKLVEKFRPTEARETLGTATVYRYLADEAA
jgi:hypothetical protein